MLAHIDGNDDQVLNRAKDADQPVRRRLRGRSPCGGREAGANVDVTHTSRAASRWPRRSPYRSRWCCSSSRSDRSSRRCCHSSIGGLAIVGTFAELFLLGSVTDVSIFAINLTTALGLGLGIDYALFMVSRFREQLAAGESTSGRASPDTVATAGRTIVVLRGDRRRRARRDAGVPAVLPAVVRLRRHRCRGRSRP